MDRLEIVREYVDKILNNMTNIKKRRNGFIHLYGVCTFCTILARKRNLNVELASICGMLHDIHKYLTLNSEEHAALGSIDARKILNELKCFNNEEIDLICTAIYHHSDKNDFHGPYEELLKDADVLQHYLYNTSDYIQSNETTRLYALLKNLKI